MSAEPEAVGSVDTVRPVSSDVEHAIVEEGGVTECVILPGVGSEYDLMTTWVAAEEGSFVSLDEAR